MEPRNAQTVAIQVQNFGFAPMRYEFPPTREFFSRGILTVDGPFWEHSRALIKPIFAKAQIANLGSLDAHLAKMIAYIPVDGSTFDLQPLLKRLFLDMNTEFIFGESSNVLEPDTDTNPDTFVNAFDQALLRLAQRLHLGRLWFLAGKTKQFRSDYRRVHEFIDSFVAKALKDKDVNEKSGLNDSADDDFHKTYFLPKELGKEVEDPVELRFQLLHIFFPARDSIAIVVTNVFFFLARHPEVFAKLREEVESIGDAPLTFELLKSMLYLRYVYNESNFPPLLDLRRCVDCDHIALRLRPPTPQSLRTALHDCIIPTGGGPDGKSPIFLQKHDHVEIWQSCMHRDPDIWGADAEQFRPERWVTARPTWEFIPFFGGPRICPAQQLVFTQATFTTVRLLQKFKGLKNRDPQPEFVELNKITVESRNGCSIALTPA
ncbi:MAG: hypothetical protein M1822_009459 [Bathelium mastoideum]|nr:MAG: hypothetical protein M1822_009459 [Bathelium mastoideum]